jgi:hypothetical protein
MRHTKSNDTYIIRIDKGEEVVSNLTKFCVENDIKNATFNGIGALEWLKCGYYALSEKQYHFAEYDSLVEVVSLTGNVMLKDGKPLIHVHGVFTDTGNKAFGGHIVEMRVGVVLEVMLSPLSTSLSRLHDDCIGLYLIDLENEQ